MRPALVLTGYDQSQRKLRDDRKDPKDGDPMTQHCVVGGTGL
jgi:hypothetical protein